VCKFDGGEYKNVPGAQSSLIVLKKDFTNS
jgi:hypothetical protein